VIVGFGCLGPDKILDVQESTLIQFRRAQAGRFTVWFESEQERIIR